MADDYATWLPQAEQDGLMCQEPDCKQLAFGCYLPDDEPDQPSDILCAEHATKHGYCWGCANFWAGCEDFDFDPRGLCSNCRYDPDLGYESDDYDDEYCMWADVP